MKKRILSPFKRHLEILDRFKLSRKITKRYLLVSVSVAVFLFLVGFGYNWYGNYKTSKEIKELADRFSLYEDGLPEAPSEVRDPYLEGLKALDEWRLEDARDSFLEALKQTKDYLQLGAIHQALGRVYGDLAGFKESRNHYQKALDLAEYADDSEGRTWALNGLGLAECNLGNYEKALVYHSEGLKIAEAIENDEVRGAHLGNIGSVLSHKGDLAGAEKAHREALEIHAEIGNKYGEAADLGNIGLVLRQKGDLDGA